MTQQEQQQEIVNKWIENFKSENNYRQAKNNGDNRCYDCNYSKSGMPEVCVCMPCIHFDIKYSCVCDKFTK
jgi:hypothetical protein